MKHNLKETLLGLGAKKSMVTWEIKAYFVEKTGMGMYKLEAILRKPNYKIAPEDVFLISDFFNTEYKAMGMKDNFSFYSLYSADKAGTEPTNKFKLKKPENV